MIIDIRSHYCHSLGLDRSHNRCPWLRGDEDVFLGYGQTKLKFWARVCKIEITGNKFLLLNKLKIGVVFIKGFVADEVESEYFDTVWTKAKVSQERSVTTDCFIKINLAKMSCVT